MDSIHRIIYSPTEWIIDEFGNTVDSLGIEIKNVSQQKSYCVHDIGVLFNSILSPFYRLQCTGSTVIQVILGRCTIETLVM